MMFSPSSRALPVIAVAGLLAIVLSASPVFAQAPKILIIRGGTGTGGVNSPNDGQLSDIFNPAGINDWVELRQLLEAQGFIVEQAVEGNVISTTNCALENGAMLDFPNMNLAQYDIVVFGSNNALYHIVSTAPVDAVEDYVLHGGAALFISDANWGRSWNDAPTSDQAFLDRFGLQMNQDRGTYAVSAAQGDFLQPAHPILAGVSAIDGEGVSPVRFWFTRPGTKATKIVAARGGTRDNDGNCATSNGQGTNRNVDSNDCALIVVEAGLGRVAGHFDRNTFFSTGGAGTELSNLDNTQYAINLFNWLSEAGSVSYTTYAANLTGPDGFSEDSESDGVLNGIEYALGIDGNDPSGENGVAGLPTGGIEGAGASARLQIDFAIASPPRGDVTLEIQVTNDLVNWNTIAQKTGPADWTGTATVTEGAVTGGRQAVSVEDVVPASGAGPRFIRLLVELTIAN